MTQKCAGVPILNNKEKDEIYKLLKNTYYPKDNCGGSNWLLPDGTILNFSVLEHSTIMREIGDALNRNWDYEPTELAYNWGMSVLDMVRLGRTRNLLLVKNEMLVDFNRDTKITPEQKKELLKCINHPSMVNGRLLVTVGKPNEEDEYGDAMEERIEQTIDVYEDKTNGAHIKVLKKLLTINKKDDCKSKTKYK